MSFFKYYLRKRGEEREKEREREKVYIQKMFQNIYLNFNEGFNYKNCERCMLIYSVYNTYTEIYKHTHRVTLLFIIIYLNIAYIF